MKLLWSLCLLVISLNCAAQSEYEVVKICVDSVKVTYAKEEFRMDVLQAIQFNGTFPIDKQVDMNKKLREALKP